MLSLSDSNRVGVVEIFDYTSRYLGGLLTVVLFWKNGGLDVFQGGSVE